MFMQKPAEYRKYAEECERLARQLPSQHKETLLAIARAWRVCADEAQRKNEAGQPKISDALPDC